MRAAGFRPATPALAQMLEISTDHACDAVGQHTPVGLRSPQSLLLSSTIDATGRCSQDLQGRHQASNRHRARCGRVLSLPRLRALQVCRRRPTLGVAAASTAGIRKPSQTQPLRAYPTAPSGTTVDTQIPDPRCCTSEIVRAVPEAAVSKCNKGNSCMSPRVRYFKGCSHLRLEDFSPILLCQRRRGRHLN